MSAVPGVRPIEQFAKVDHVQLELPALHTASSPVDIHDQEAPRAPSPESGPEPDRSATKWHLLVVDDEHDIRMMLRSLLEFEGYTVSEASDGLAGLAQLRASTQPLVVLLDYKMPRMNGEEMLHAVIADPDLAGRHAFIFVTANLPAFSPELLQLLSAAAIPVIQKPYSLSKLLHEIESAVARLGGTGKGTGDGPAS